MEESIRLRSEVGKEVHQSLTRLLDLADFEVVGYEQDLAYERLTLFCVPRFAYALCPECGRVSERVHQSEQRVVRDMAAWGMDCYLEFEQRRFMCAECGVPFSERWIEIEPWRQYTRRYEHYILTQYQQNSISEIARREGLGYKAAQGIFYRQAERATNPQTQAPLSRLGVDEISLKKRHKQFVLVISYLERGVVLDVLADRRKETFEAWLMQWTPAERAAISEVSIDMWPPYRLAVESCLPNAQLVADRFHLMQNLNRAVTQARRSLQRDADSETKEQLKGSRWLLVKNEDALSAEEQALLAALYELSPELAQLHRAKEAFRQIYESAASRQEAAWRFLDWMYDALQQQLAPLNRFLKTLSNWGEQILNFFNQRTTQGLVEGMNNKIKLILRRAFGYRNFDHFVMRLRLECGSLT